MGLEIISDLKKKLNFTTEQLAKMSGVPFGTLSKILNGTTKDPKLETLKALAKALNCTLDDFDDPKEDSITSKERSLFTNFNKLNNQGKDEAVKRVSELTEISKYTVENNITKLNTKKKELWEEEGKEHLMPIACHDDNLSEEEKSTMDNIINTYLTNKNK